MSISKPELLRIMKHQLLPANCTFGTKQLLEAAKPLIALAIEEDMPDAEMVDARMIIDRKLTGTAIISTNVEGMLAGGWLLMQIASYYRRNMDMEILARDGSALQPGQQIAILAGPIAQIVMMERMLLNFLSRLSGTATLTNKCVQAVAQTTAVITDTRKTLPAYRVLDKYAVQCGGGKNHRMGLCDGVMIKDNHISAMSGATITQMVRRVRQGLKRRQVDLPIWVEVEQLSQLPEALASSTDLILLDNMSLSQLRRSVQMRNEWFTRNNPVENVTQIRPLLEASGGVDLSNITDVAYTGVDRIAIGALTHSAPALDVTLELQSPPKKTDDTQ